MSQAVHPDSVKFPFCPFDNNQGRIRKQEGRRYCRGFGQQDDCTKRLVVLSDCLACPWPTSKDPPPPPRPKVGDVLACILKDRRKATATESCQCATHIQEMNNWGPDGCEQHFETIVDWLLAAASETPGVHRWIPTLFQRVVLEGDVRDAIQEVREWQPNG